MPHLIAKSIDIDSAELLDKHSRSLTVDNELWSKRRRPCTPRRRSYKNHRARQKGIRLDDYTEAPTLLFVSSCARRSQLVNVTPLHGGSPSAARPPASPDGRLHQPRVRQLRPVAPHCDEGPPQPQGSTFGSPRIDSTPTPRASGVLAVPRYQVERIRHAP